VEFETNEAAVSIAVIFPTGLHDFSAWLVALFWIITL
jgi:hypothetical protein